MEDKFELNCIFSVKSQYYLLHYTKYKNETVPISLDSNRIILSNLIINLFYTYNILIQILEKEH